VPSFLIGYFLSAARAFVAVRSRAIEVHAMSAGASSSEFAQAGRRPSQWPAEVAASRQDARGYLAAYQRLRMLSAAAAVAGEQGYDGVSATSVVARARVSRKTFYEVFESREDCLLAVIERALADAAILAGEAYEQQQGWSARLRAGLAGLLTFLEREEAGALALAYLLGYGPNRIELRAEVLRRLRVLVDQGRAHAGARDSLSPLTGEFVVGGVLATVYAHMQDRRPPQLVDLLNPLMCMIVLPYLGPGAAARELTRATPERIEPPSRAVTEQLQGLDMRVTYRTARVLEAIRLLPESSNATIAAHANIVDPGQISKLLARLLRLELIENMGAGSAAGEANAWRLTDTGKRLESTVSRKVAGTGR
jgi:AcrR family transcriptional regulator